MTVIQSVWQLNSHTQCHAVRYNHTSCLAQSTDSQWPVCWLDYGGIKGGVTEKLKIIFSKTCRPGLGPSQFHTQKASGFSQGKRPGCEANISVPPASRLRISAAKRPHNGWCWRHHYCSLYSEVHREKERIKCNSTVVIRVTCSWEQLFV
jgi:hypothetical protein